MAVALMKEKAAWAPAPGAPARAGGKPNRPLRCVLVGGHVGKGYTNVERLPEHLWSEFGIAVIDHVTGRAPTSNKPGAYDIAIVLTDLVDGNLIAWAREAADRIVSSPATWAHIRSELERVGIFPYPGRHFVMEVVNVTRRRAVPEPPVEKEEEEEVAQPVPAKKPETSPARKLPAELVTKLREMKDLMVVADVKQLHLILDEEDRLSVEFEQVVRTKGVEVL